MGQEASLWRDRLTTSNGKYADANAADVFAPRIAAIYFMTLEPRFVHREKHVSTLSQKLLISPKIVTVELFRIGSSRKARGTTQGSASAKLAVTGIRQCVEGTESSHQ